MYFETTLIGEESVHLNERCTYFNYTQAGIKALVLISVMSFGRGLNASGKALFLWLSLAHVEPLSKDHEARAPIL